jgi:hypothetical protein
MNYQKECKKRLLEAILTGTLVAFSCLTRASYCFSVVKRVFPLPDGKVAPMIINNDEGSSFEEGPSSHVLKIPTVLSATLYGRICKFRKWIDGLHTSRMEVRCS